MMNRPILLFSFLCCFLLGHNCAPVKNGAGLKKITVQFDGKRYDRLYLETYLFGFSGGGYYNIFAGSSPDGYLWEFIIPDSIHQKVQRYGLKPELYDAESKTAYVISISPDADGKMKTPFFPIPDKLIRLTYLRSETNAPEECLPDYRIVQDSVVWVEIGKRDMFIFEPAENKEMAIACETEQVLYRAYNGPAPREELYGLVYGILDSMITQHPDSQYLISEICSYRFRFSNPQLENLYGKLSEANKASYAGKLVKNLFDFDPDNFQFTNVELPAWDTHKPEWVIADTTKPTLIIFSASWCGPCHALVPTLKEIYAEKSDELNMVYISVDTEKSAEAWATFMREDQIPWRSLILLGDPLAIQLKYNINGVPTMFFVEAGPDLKSKEINAGTYDALKEKILKLR